MAVRIRIPGWHEMDKNCTPLLQLVEDFLLAKRSAVCSDCSVVLVAYDHHWWIEPRVWKSDPLLHSLPMQVRQQFIIANKGNQVYNPHRSFASGVLPQWPVSNSLIAFVPKKGDPNWQDEWA